MKEQTFSILNFPLRSVDPLCCCLVAKSCPKSFVILWTVAHQAPLSVHGISQARILEYKLLNQNDDFSLQLCKLKIKKKKKTQPALNISHIKERRFREIANESDEIFVQSSAALSVSFHTSYFKMLAGVISG